MDEPDYEYDDNDRTSSSASESSPSSDTKEDCKSRTARKIGEKLRRDRLNNHLNELSEEVPWIAESDKRLDKVSILRLTVSYMKLHHGLKKKKLTHIWQPNTQDKDVMQQYLQEAVDGFLMVVSKTGSVIYVSKAVYKCLGHTQVDIIGNSVYNIVHPDDHELLHMQFYSRDPHESHLVNNSDSNHPCTQVNTASDEHRSFYLRMQKLLDGEDGTRYESVHVLGHVRFNGSRMISKQKKVSVLNDCWLVAVCKLIKKEPIMEISQFYTNKNEFVSQHAMDGKILFSDHRVALITGFMPDQNSGKSVYSTLYPEDMDAVAVSHMKIMTDGETPATIFRMKNVNGDPVFIMARSVVVKEAVSKKPKFIVSINVCLDKSEGIKLLEEQKKKVQALIAATKGMSLQDTDEDVKCSTLTTTKADRIREPNGVVSNSSELLKFDCQNRNKNSRGRSDTFGFKLTNGNFSGSRHSDKTCVINKSTKRHIEEEGVSHQTPDGYQVSIFSSVKLASQRNGSPSLLKSLLLSPDDEGNDENDTRGCDSKCETIDNRDNESIRTERYSKECGNRNDILSFEDESMTYSYRSNLSCSNNVPNTHNSFLQSVSYSTNTSVSDSYVPQSTMSQNHDLFLENSNCSTLPNLAHSSHSSFNLKPVPNLFQQSAVISECNQAPVSDKNLPRTGGNSIISPNSNDLTCTSRKNTLINNNTFTSSSEKKKSISESNYLNSSILDPNGQKFNMVSILQNHIHEKALSNTRTDTRQFHMNSDSMAAKETIPKFESLLEEKYLCSRTALANLGRANFNSNNIQSDKTSQVIRNNNYNPEKIQSSNCAAEKGSAAFPLSWQNGRKNAGQCCEVDSTESSSALRNAGSLVKQEKELKVRSLLAQQLQIKHNQIDRSLKNQEVEIELMRLQMETVREAKNSSHISTFVDRLSQLQNEVDEQKKLLQILKDEKTKQCLKPHT